MIYEGKYNLASIELFSRIIEKDNSPDNLLIFPFNFRYDFRMNFEESTSKYHHISSDKCVFFSTLKRPFFTYIPKQYIQTAPAALKHLELKEGMNLLTAKEWNTYPIGKKEFDAEWHTMYKEKHADDFFFINFRLAYWIKRELLHKEIYYNPQEMFPVRFKENFGELSAKALIIFFEYILSDNNDLTEVLPFLSVPAIAYNLIKELNLNRSNHLGSTLLSKLNEGYSFEQINSMVELFNEFE